MGPIFHCGRLTKIEIRTHHPIKKKKKQIKKNPRCQRINLSVKDTRETIKVYKDKFKIVIK
jgi:hypothetical protein